MKNVSPGAPQNVVDDDILPSPKLMARRTVQGSNHNNRLEPIVGLVCLDVSSGIKE